MGHQALDVIAEQHQQETVNSVMTSLPESDLSALLHFPRSS